MRLSGFFFHGNLTQELMWTFSNCRPILPSVPPESNKSYLQKQRWRTEWVWGTVQRSWLVRVGRRRSKGLDWLLWRHQSLVACLSNCLTPTPAQDFSTSSSSRKEDSEGFSCLTSSDWSHHIIKIIYMCTLQCHIFTLGFIPPYDVWQ